MVNDKSSRTIHSAIRNRAFVRQLLRGRAKACCSLQGALPSKKPVHLI
jgi:hypothetical protein